LWYLNIWEECRGVEASLAQGATGYLSVEYVTEEPLLSSSRSQIARCSTSYQINLSLVQGLLCECCSHS
jgi:hypothetical protein